MPSTTVPEISCTLCIWYSKTTPAYCRAKAPDGTYHYLCKPHAEMHADKYKESYLLTDYVRANLLSGRAPFDRRGKPR